MEERTSLGLSDPRECVGVIGILVSLLGAAGSLWVLVVFEGPIWGFALLVLFAVLGWTSFLWCGAWAQSPPADRTGAAFIGVVVGAVGLGVGILSVILFEAPTWSYLVAILSFVVFAGSTLLWGRSGFH